jgi:L-lactate dehydrogenase complex protein LldG
MSNDREAILNRVNAALAPLPKRAPLPDFDRELTVMRQARGITDLVALFGERLKVANALLLADVADLVARLKAGGWMHGYCDPALWPQLAPAFGAEFRVETDYDRTRIDDYAFGITRAAGAIAETGTIVLGDAVTSHRLAALTPWVHVAVISRATLRLDLQEAVAAFGPENNVIWVTGPSKTADVEGILIEGVHGPGVQMALLVD